jgi:hypothetical protein
MSALPPKADIAGRQLNVRFVPKEQFWFVMEMTFTPNQIAIQGLLISGQRM